MDLNINKITQIFTLAGVATPLKAEVSSEMLYLLHTRSGMFQVTMKGWWSNSGLVVWGRGGSCLEAAASRGDGELLGRGVGVVLARGGGNVLEVKGKKDVERDGVETGEGSLGEAV